MDFSLLFCLIISCFISVIAAYTTNITCPIQYLYQFGDAVGDTGNQVRIVPVGPNLPATRPPYGVTFPGRPTGRWSDGRLVIDYIATELGLPLLNPYADSKGSFRSGVNFAVSGATALDSCLLASKGVIVPSFVSSLSIQLTWFRTYLASSICSTPQECGDHLRQALIIVGRIGGNDINYGLEQAKSLDEIRTYVPFVNQAISNFTREIIQAGATRVVVPGNFPIGCFPFALAAFTSNDSTSYDEIGCLKSINDLVTYENNNLQTTLEAMRREFPNVAIFYADYYNAFLSIIRLAPLFGFDQRTLLMPCCRSRSVSRLSPEFCGNPGVPVCRNPERYIHWDGISLTQEAHRRIFQFVFPYILAEIECLQR